MNQVGGGPFLGDEIWVHCLDRHGQVRKHTDSARSRQRQTGGYVGFGRPSGKRVVCYCC